MKVKNTHTTQQTRLTFESTGATKENLQRKEQNELFTSTFWNVRCVVTPEQRINTERKKESFCLGFLVLFFVVLVLVRELLDDGRFLSTW